MNESDRPELLVPDASAAAVGPVRASIAHVTAQLRHRISMHMIPPGARLREWDLAAEFGIPRLSAREALDGLVHLGLVDRQPNRGVVVRRLGLAEILQLFELREVNEGLCARLAARNAPPESWDDLIQLFGDTMERVVERNDLDSYATNYARLHARLMAAGGSPPLTELLKRLNDATVIFGRRILLVSDRTAHALQDHRAVLAALGRGDAVEAERLRRTTIANVKDAVERYHAFIQ